MKASYIKFIHIILSLLGFSAVACDKGTIDPDDNGKDNGGDLMVEYGCPYVSFEVKGSVTDEEGNPLKGIALTRYGFGTVKTDEKGGFAVGYTKDGFSMPEKDTVILRFHDVDGPENGSFQDASYSVECDLVSGKDGHWKMGGYAPESDVKVVLKKK